MMVKSMARGESVKLKVVEAQGCGNRFVIVDRLDEPIKEELLGSIAVDLGRRFSTDSILLITSSESADARMRVLEKDGTESDMCGNGIRCVAKYLIEKHGFDEELSIETNAGIREVKRDAKLFRVEMGIPVQDGKVWGRRMNVDGEAYTAYLVNSGEPHVIVFVEDVEKVDVDRIGRAIRNGFGKEGANADFVQIIDPETIRIRTYERGVEGETPACGTGATAAVVAAAETGRISQKETTVRCNGGNLRVSYLNGDATLEGPAELESPGTITVNV